MKRDIQIDRHIVSLRLVAALMLALVLWVAVSLDAKAADATLTWTNPTQRENGDPLPIAELKEIQIDYGKCLAGNIFPSVPDGTKAFAAPATTGVITGLAYGTWCFRARAVDTASQASVNTGTVWKQYLAPPKPPTILTVASLVWEMKIHPVDGPYLARVVGHVDAGKPCLGLAPQYGFDLFAVDRADVTLERGVKQDSTLVAQCEAT